MSPTRDVETFGQRVQLEALRPELAAKYGVTAKTGFAIDQGDVIGVITASTKARRRSRSNAAADYAAAVTVIEVDDASVFVPGDVLKLEDGTTIATVAADGVNAEDNELTVSATAVAITDGDAILASDGSQVAKGIADEASDGVGDTQIAVIVSGLLTESLCSGLDASAKAELGGASVLGGIFKF